MNTKRKKYRAKRRLKMSDNDIQGLINEDDNTVSDSDSFNILRSDPSNLTEGNSITKVKPVLPTTSAERLKQTELKHTYDLREHPLKSYRDDDQDQEDFSPDDSEYLPSPEQKQRQNDLFDRLLISEHPLKSYPVSPEQKQRQNDLFDSCSTLGSEFVDDFSKNILKTPSTISNFSNQFAHEVDFVASPSEIHIVNSCPSTPRSFAKFSSSITPAHKKCTSTPKELSNTCTDLVIYQDIHQRIFNSITPCLDITLKPEEKATTSLRSDSYNQEYNKIPPTKSSCHNDDEENLSDNEKTLNPTSLLRTYNLIIEISPMSEDDPWYPVQQEKTDEQEINNNVQVNETEKTEKYYEKLGGKKTGSSKSAKESDRNSEESLDDEPQLKQNAEHYNESYSLEDETQLEQTVQHNDEPESLDDELQLEQNDKHNDEPESLDDKPQLEQTVEHDDETVSLDDEPQLEKTVEHDDEHETLMNDRTKETNIDKPINEIEIQKLSCLKLTVESKNSCSINETPDSDTSTCRDVEKSNEYNEKENSDLVPSTSPNFDAVMQKASDSESEYVIVVQIVEETIGDQQISDEDKTDNDVEQCETNDIQEDAEINTIENDEEPFRRNELIEDEEINRGSCIILEENLHTPSTSTVPKKLTRKRPRDEKEWQDNKAKKLKNSGEPYTACRSKKEYSKKTLGPICSCRRKCGENISQNQRQTIFVLYYKLADHERQWDFILRHTKSETIKKMTIDRKNNRTQTVQYYFTVNNTKIQVCRQFFMNTLSISNQVIYTALEKLQSKNELKDNRRKHENRPRKVAVETEESIIQHINSFPTKESHYVRKDTQRKYLSEFLNISKMYRLYQDWFKEQTFSCGMATKRHYESVFNTKFNLSFFKPKKDQCSICTMFHEGNAARKTELQESYDLHIKNKEKVRHLKKTEKETFDKTTSTVAIFDLEKVLTIPQSPVGIFHYKRNYSVYNFTVYDSTNCQGYCYVWHQQIAKRGAIEIGSCLLQFIQNEHKRGIKEISFYSDGCAGQNKNRFIYALYIYLVKIMQMTITHRFFTTGHGQSEGDSMHSTVERELKHKVVYTPDQIYSAIMNAKISGNKYKVKEMIQADFLNIKALISGKNWVKDENGNKVQWFNVLEVRASHLHPDCLYFKYNFEEEYLKLNTTNFTRIVRRKKKTRNSASVNTANDDLKQAYQSFHPVSKDLYTDLMSLCSAQAIPQHYHSFYESLHFADGIQDESDDD